MMPPVVCVATPHNRLSPGTLQAVFTQTYRGHWDNFFTSRNPDPFPGYNIIAAYKRIRAVFLADPAYTHLWIVEHDVIPPPEALDKLLAVAADIAYGCYCFRRGAPVVNVSRSDTADSMTGDPRAWRRDFTAGAVVECAGLGFGCTLIRRHVLERFEMRTLGGGGDADTCLAMDARRAGLSQRADLSVVCGHVKPDGQTIWPAGERPFYRKAGISVPDLVTIRAKESFGHWDEFGRARIVAQGATSELDRELAASMQARGQVEIV